MSSAPDLVNATKEIVVAYVAHNNLSEEKITAMIENVHASLVKITGSAVGTVDAAAPANLEPAVPIKKSVTDEYIVCLEDGKRLKVMTRYLKTKYAMTPEEYRRKWNLPHDYPMTAPGYSKKRSEMAHGMGLGRIKKKTVSRGNGRTERLSAE